MMYGQTLKELEQYKKSSSARQKENLTRSQNPLRPTWSARKAEWVLAKLSMKLEGLLGDL